MTRQHGMSLAELMIAMALGLMLTAGIATLFTQTRESFNQDEQIATLQANLRFAVEMIVEDATMAGFWGGLLDPVAITEDSTVTIGQDCGAGVAAWAYDLLTPLSAADNISAADAHAAFDCITEAEFQAGTDIIGFKKVRGLAIQDDPNLCTHDFNATDALVANTVYLAENGIIGLLFAHEKSGTTVVDGCVENREYAPVLYYVRNFSITAGDGIPTLCRKVLTMGATPAMSTECLVEGIEQMQVEYGVDGDGNGVPEQYVSAPSAAQLADATVVRVHLLGRSLRSQRSYQNPKTYALGNLDYTPNDNFYRRSATTTIVLRNPTNLRNLGN